MHGVRVVLALSVALLLAAALTGCGAAKESTPAASSATAATSSSTPPPKPKPKPKPKPSALPDEDGSLVPDNLVVPPTDAPRFVGRTFGADASWPQCPEGQGIPQKQTLGAPMPTDAAKFVILGLTNGPSFTPNPCLADQVAWVRERGLAVSAYAVVSWPDAATVNRLRDEGPYRGSTRIGALRNVGYQAALHAVSVMRAASLPSPSVWVDVEQVPSFEWAGSKVENAAVIEGAVRGFRDSGHRVGLYSYQGAWQQFVGDLRLGLPEWRPAGQTSMAEALRRCSPSYSFQGEAALLGQWVEDDRDRNVTCPGQEQKAAAWFHQYPAG